MKNVVNYNIFYYNLKYCLKFLSGRVYKINKQDVQVVHFVTFVTSSPTFPYCAVNKLKGSGVTDSGTNRVNVKSSSYLAYFCINVLFHFSQCFLFNSGFSIKHPHLDSLSVSLFNFFDCWLQAVVGSGLGGPEARPKKGPSDDVIMLSQP